MERVKGYVVGPKTINGRTVWVVRVKQSGHPLDGVKLVVAPQRQQLKPSLDVDFLLTTADDQAMAADVLPQGVVSAQQKGLQTMMRRYLSIAAVAVLAIAVTVGFAFRQNVSKMTQDQLLEWKVSAIATAIRHMPIDDLVTDDIIRRALFDANDPFYNARRAVWDKQLCAPVWHDSHDSRPGEGGDSTCYNALYASGPVRGNNSWYERAGLPTTLSPIVEDVREAAYGVVRTVINDSQLLRTFYYKKKLAVVKMFAELPAEKRKDYYARLLLARDSFAHVLDMQVQEALKLAQDTSREQSRLWDVAEKMPWGSDERAAATKVYQAAHDEAETRNNYLLQLVGGYDGLRLVEFATHRVRQSTESHEIVRAYLEILNDAIREIEFRGLDK